MTTPIPAALFADPAPAELRLGQGCGRAMDRGTELDEIWRLMSTPDVIVGRVHAVTETGSLVVASASGSQLPGYAGGAARAIWIVGAQKVVVCDLPVALSRLSCSSRRTR
jgi:hypothetical protein